MASQHLGCYLFTRHKRIHPSLTAYLVLGIKNSFLWYLVRTIAPKTQNLSKCWFICTICRIHVNFGVESVPTQLSTLICIRELQVLCISTDAPMIGPMIKCLQIVMINSCKLFCWYTYPALYKATQYARNSVLDHRYFPAMISQQICMYKTIGWLE